MLVLTRKHSETIVIGDNIRLTVVSIRGSQVRFGVTAPPAVLIRREELCPEARDTGMPSNSPETLKVDP